MNKNCKLTIGAMLLLTTAFSVAEVRAQTCVVPPTCEGLGYDKAASDCGGLAKLRCPFDDSKYFCTAYTDQDGNKAIAIGDIIYSDGTYSSEPVPLKKPVGILINLSGLILSTSPVDTQAEKCSGSGTSVLTDKCKAYTPYGTSGWQYINQTQLYEVYTYKTQINNALAKLTSSYRLSKDLLGSCSDSTSYGCSLNLSTGRFNSSIDCGSTFDVFCVLDMSNLTGGTTPTPTPTTYKVGDTYMKDGIALGKVVEVDSSGQHGILAVAMGQGDASTANSVCVAKTNGGLNWGLATGKHACTLVQNAGSYTDYYSSPDEMTCGIHSASGSGACQNSKYHTAPIRTNCESTNMLGYVCAAVF